jgi:hypothetical protein
MVMIKRGEHGAPKRTLFCHVPLEDEASFRPFATMATPVLEWPLQWNGQELVRGRSSRQGKMRNRNQVRIESQNPAQSVAFSKANARRESSQKY